MSIYTYEEFNEAAQNGSTVDNDAKFFRTCCSESLIKYMRQKKKETQQQKRKRYNYMLTFTLKKDDEDEDKVEAYIKKQLHRKPLQIVEAHIVKEYTKKGRAHWHTPLTTLTPLKKDRFHYYEKQYGFVEINKTKAQNLEEGLNYINKDNQSVKII